MERKSVIPEDHPVTEPEGWELNGDPVQVDDADKDALVEALFDSVSILRHVGGAVTIAPVREERAPDVFVTRGYLFRWHSTVPAVKPEPDAE